MLTAFISSLALRIATTPKYTPPLPKQSNVEIVQEKIKDPQDLPIYFVPIVDKSTPPDPNNSIDTGKTVRDFIRILNNNSLNNNSLNNNSLGGTTMEFFNEICNNVRTQLKTSQSFDGKLYAPNPNGVGEPFTRNKVDLTCGAPQPYNAQVPYFFSQTPPISSTRREGLTSLPIQ